MTVRRFVCSYGRDMEFRVVGHPAASIMLPAHGTAPTLNSAPLSSAPMAKQSMSSEPARYSACLGKARQREAVLRSRAETFLVCRPPPSLLSRWLILSAFSVRTDGTTFKQRINRGLAARRHLL